MSRKAAQHIYVGRNNFIKLSAYFRADATKAMILAPIASANNKYNRAMEYQKWHHIIDVEVLMEAIPDRTAGTRMDKFPRKPFSTSRTCVFVYIQLQLTNTFHIYIRNF